MKKKKITILISILMFTPLIKAQEVENTTIKKQPSREVKLNFNEDGSHYIKATGLVQVWLRHTELNPGSAVNGFPVEAINDIGIRRLRFQVFGQLSDRVFFYTQFGQNNFNSRSPKFIGSFFHDALGEIKIKDNKLSIGAGLTGWSGFLRYSTPSIGTLMTLDAPLYQQATASISDQFLRKLSVYAKGQLGRLDYQLALSTPMDIPGSDLGINLIDSGRSHFNPQAAEPQIHGYFKYQFFDIESNTTPYEPGTYIGKKRICALGFGFVSQDKAMWKTNAAQDTITQSMLLFGSDFIIESPINSSKTMALTLYVAYSLTDYGDNYQRNVGVMNPANGWLNDQTISGVGNEFPMIGTGNTLYFQSGLVFGKNFISEGGKLQPYVAAQVSDFDGLDQTMLMTEAGLNYYLHGSHDSKISFNYQSRPIFDLNEEGKKVEVDRKGMYQIQLQVAF